MKDELKVVKHEVSGDDEATFALTLGRLREESQGSKELGVIIKPGKEPFIAVYAGDIRVIAQLMKLLHVGGMVDMDKILAMADENLAPAQA